MAKVRPSILVDAMSGRSGEVVAARGPGGNTLRTRPHYRYTPPPGQARQNARVATANLLWAEMDMEEVELWNDYARRVTRLQRFTGASYALSGHGAFVGLTTKLLQMDPEAEIPTVPPEGDFDGDAITLELGAAPGQLLYEASGPNAPGVVTELRLQKLPNPRRKPTRYYHTKLFTAFTPTDLTEPLPVPPGAYAGAYRFVETATGRVTGECILQKVLVPAM